MDKNNEPDFRKSSKRAIIYIFLIILMVLYVSNKLNNRIDLPEATDIVSIKIDDDIVFTEQEDITSILAALSKGEKQSTFSVNEYPTQSEYMILIIVTRDYERRFFLYQDNLSYFLEEPYVAIYKLDKTSWNAFYSICEK